MNKNYQDIVEPTERRERRHAGSRLKNFPALFQPEILWRDLQSIDNRRPNLGGQQWEFDEFLPCELRQIGIQPVYHLKCMYIILKYR